MTSRSFEVSLRTGKPSEGPPMGKDDAMQRLLFALWAFGLLFVTGCIGAGDCPEGWVQNANGDCVQPEDTYGLPDGDQRIYVEDERPQDDDDDDDDDGTDGDGASDDDDDDDDGPSSCSSDAVCPVGTTCHEEVSGGICASACWSSSDCYIFTGSYYCSHDQDCIPGNEPDNCTLDQDCAYGDVCHEELNLIQCHPTCRSDGECQQWGGLTFSCAADERCRVLGGCEGDDCLVSCQSDNQCPLGEPCHVSFLGGVCWPACIMDSDCIAPQDLDGDGVDESYFCNALGRCRPHPDLDCPTSNECCETTADCSQGNVCHPDVAGGLGECGSACTDTDSCEGRYGPGRLCNAQGVCIESQSICHQDDECSSTQVCHGDEEENGFCAAPCQNDDYCEVLRQAQGISEELNCNAFGECVTGVVSSDGDIDGDVEEEPVDGDVEEDDTCPMVQQGDTLRLDVPTVSIRLNPTVNGSPYFDTEGNSAIYLRDNDTGNQFLVYEQVSDGSALPEIEIMAGNYNLVMKNSMDQKVTCAERVALTQDGVYDMPVPVITISGTLTKNGEPFPTLDEVRRGALTLYDRSKRVDTTLVNVGNGVNSFNRPIFAGTFDVYFNSYLSNDSDSYQSETLRTQMTIEEDTAFTFNVQTVRVSGSVLFNGAAPEDSGLPRGEVWMINTVKGDRFYFADLGQSGAVSFDREILSGSYYPALTRQGTDGSEYLWRMETPVTFSSNQANLELDFPRVRIYGDVLERGQPLADHENLDRGSLYLLDKRTNQRFPLVSLGMSGSVSFDTELCPGSYDVVFEGKLMDDPYFMSSYPRTTQSATLESSLSILNNLDHDVNITSKRVSATLTLNGEPYTEGGYAGNYITVRKASSYDDIPVIHFDDDYQSATNTFSVVPGTYDIRYSGSNFTGRYLNYSFGSDFAVSEDTSIELSTDFRTLRIAVTDPVRQKTLKELIDEGVFIGAEISMIDNTLRSRATASSEVNDNNQFVIVRPDGNYDILLRVLSEQGYGEYPLAEDLEISGDSDLNYSLKFVTVTLQVLKNGGILPDSTSGYERGELIIRPISGNWLTVLSQNLGDQGIINRPFTLLHGLDYGVYLSVNYPSDAFAFRQWRYLGCFSVAAPESSR